MRANKMRYLVVLDKNNVIDALNCSQETMKSDKVITEITKDDWYNIETIANEDGIQGTLSGKPLEVFQKYHDIYFNERYKEFNW